MKGLEISKVTRTATHARQLNALLQNIFLNGTEGCQSDNELIGLAYDLAGKVCLFMDDFEKKADDETN